MKFILVTIKAGGDTDKNPMVWPKIWNAQHVQRNKIGPTILDGGIRRGGATAEALLHVTNRLAEAYTIDDDIREMTQAEAEAWILANPQVQGRPDEEVTDANRLTAIIAKKAAGQALSQEDKDAVNPDNSTAGVIKTPKTLTSLYDL